MSSIDDGPLRAAAPGDKDPSPREQTSRLYVHEPGWQIHIKRGSERAFCYLMAPGQDYYHRLLDGELYLHHGDERICLNCAARRGIISYEPRILRDESPRFLADAGEPPIFVLGVDDK